jgi:DNA-binding transcriptional MerR regulator
MTMEQDTIYYITEAAKLVCVEPHVLRYWEDELQLPIRRNEMGHRCYTGQDIKQLQEIKALKEQGLQLKAIRTILPKAGEGKEQSVMTRAQKYMVTLSKDQTVTVETKPGSAVPREPEEENAALREPEKENGVPREPEEENAVSGQPETEPAVTSELQVISGEDEKAQKAARLQYLLQNMITQAVKTANQELCTDVKESILKELDYQFRMQEERDEERWKQEEEHYRKIDEQLRQRQKPKEKAEKGKKKIPIL